jgi:hypothetical protein
MVSLDVSHSTLSEKEKLLNQQPLNSEETNRLHESLPTKNLHWYAKDMAMQKTDWMSSCL